MAALQALGRIGAADAVPVLLAAASKGSDTEKAAAAASLAGRVSAEDAAAGSALKGSVRHSVCKWCYGGVPLEKLA